MYQLACLAYIIQSSNIDHFIVRHLALCLHLSVTGSHSRIWTVALLKCFERKYIHTCSLCVTLDENDPNEWLTWSVSSDIMTSQWQYLACVCCYNTQSEIIGDNDELNDRCDCFCVFASRAWNVVMTGDIGALHSQCRRATGYKYVAFV